MLKSGDTFIIEDEDGLKEHLQVILTDPDINEEFVTISICTYHARMEALVLLESGDHSFIKRKSVAAFRHARIRQLSSVELAIWNAIARRYESVSENLLQRIRLALVDSDFTRNDVRAYFLAAGVLNKKGR